MRRRGVDAGIDAGIDAAVYRSCCLNDANSIDENRTNAKCCSLSNRGNTVRGSAKVVEISMALHGTCVTHSIRTPSALHPHSIRTPSASALHPHPYSIRIRTSSAGPLPLKNCIALLLSTNCLANMRPPVNALLRKWHDKLSLSRQSPPSWYRGRLREELLERRNASCHMLKLSETADVFFTIIRARYNGFPI
jgi:hypothetical protein